MGKQTTSYIKLAQLKNNFNPTWANNRPPNNSKSPKKPRKSFLFCKLWLNYWKQIIHVLINQTFVPSFKKYSSPSFFLLTWGNPIIYNPFMWHMLKRRFLSVLVASKQENLCKQVRNNKVESKFINIRESDSSFGSARLGLVWWLEIFMEDKVIAIHISWKN